MTVFYRFSINCDKIVDAFKLGFVAWWQLWGSVIFAMRFHVTCYYDVVWSNIDYLFDDVLLFLMSLIDLFCDIVIIFWYLLIKLILSLFFDTQKTGSKQIAFIVKEMIWFWCYLVELWVKCHDAFDERLM